MDQIPDFEQQIREEVPEEKKKGKNLTASEEKELQEGLALEEMVKENSGFQIVKRWLDERMYHSWVDPRTVDAKGGMSKDEWMWRELNAFYAADTAKILLEDIAKAVGRAQYLLKVKSGEVQVKGFKI